VDNTLTVCEGHCITDPLVDGKKPGEGILINRGLVSVLDRLENVLERSTLYELHGIEHVAGGVHPELMDRHYTRMLELGGHLGLFDEPEYLFFCGLLGIEEHLHGHGSAEVMVPGVDDCTHAALCYHVTQLVFPALFIGEDLGGGGIIGAVEGYSSFELLVLHILGDGYAFPLDGGLEGLLDLGDIYAPVLLRSCGGLRSYGGQVAHGTHGLFSIFGNGQVSAALRALRALTTIERGSLQMLVAVRALELHAGHATRWEHRRKAGLRPDTRCWILGAGR